MLTTHKAKHILGRLRLDNRKKIFDEALEQVAQEVVDAPFLEVLKVKLDGAMTNLV